MLVADPIITEFLASNTGNLDDGNGNSSDWIELCNRSDTSIDLEQEGLTDDAENLTQ